MQVLFDQFGLFMALAAVAQLPMILGLLFLHYYIINYQNIMLTDHIIGPLSNIQFLFFQLQKPFYYIIQMNQSNFQLCQASGILRKKDQHEIAPIKTAYLPYKSSRSVYQKLASCTKLWHKLIFQASKDRKFIEEVFSASRDLDPFLDILLKLWKLNLQANHKGQIECDITRLDYFITPKGQPKIVEYNLFSVGMFNNIQKLQKIKKLLDTENSLKYPDNRPSSLFINEILQMYKRYSLKGLFVFIISQSERNFIEQRRIMIQMLEQGIRVKKMIITRQYELHVDENNDLYLQGELVSMVYYRSGYDYKEYMINQTMTWNRREMIQLSNAIKIPNVTLDIMNKKRMQVQLSKEKVYSKYLNKEEIQLFKETLVNTWDFDQMNDQQFDQLMTLLEKNPKNYILKPNMQGGGHNIYEQQTLQTLKKISKQERKKYILMEKIETISSQNILIHGHKFQPETCVYEISNYGFILSEGQQLIKNEEIGFLIRTKPENLNQGGIMVNVGSLCTWMIEEEQEKPSNT